MTTLKLSADRVDGLLDYYAGLAQNHIDQDGPQRGPVDYYLDPDEPPGLWWGHGRVALAVAGQVDAGDLRALLEGRHRRTDMPPRTAASARQWLEQAVRQSIAMDSQADKSRM